MLKSEDFLYVDFISSYYTESDIQIWYDMQGFQGILFLITFLWKILVVFLLLGSEPAALSTGWEESNFTGGDFLEGFRASLLDQ